MEFSEEKTKGKKNLKFRERKSNSSMKDCLKNSNKQTPEKVRKYRDSKKFIKKFSEKDLHLKSLENSEKKISYGKKSLKSESLSDLLNSEKNSNIGSIQNLTKANLLPERVNSKKHFFGKKNKIENFKLSYELISENKKENFKKKQINNIINPQQFENQKIFEKKQINNIYGSENEITQNENLDGNIQNFSSFNFFLKNTYNIDKNKMSLKNFEKFYSKNDIEKFLQHSRVKLTFWQFDKIWENCQKKKNGSVSFKEFIEEGFSMKLIHK